MENLKTNKQQSRVVHEMQSLTARFYMRVIIT